MPIKAPYIFGASVIGSQHVYDAMPCQDACCYGFIGGVIGLIAAADGLGSASLSHMGSRLAVESAISSAREIIMEALKAQLHSTSNPLSRLIKGDLYPLRNNYLLRGCSDINLSEIPLKMLNSARDALNKRAQEDDIRLSALATTLIAAVFHMGRLYTAQIGDGAVVAKVNGSLMMVSGPENSEYANEVTPITSDDWVEEVIIAEVNSGVQSVAVFSDGCQRAALLKTSDGYAPFDRFFNPVFTFADTIDSIDSGVSELAEFLQSEKMSEFSEDDKTLVLAVVDNG